MADTHTGRLPSELAPPVVSDQIEAAQVHRPQAAQQRSRSKSSVSSVVSNEGDTFTRINDRTRLFPSTAYDPAAERSRAEVRAQQPATIRRKLNPSPSRASQFLRHLSKRVSKTPKSPRPASFLALSPKGDQYEQLGARDAEYELDPVGVDLSTLTGLGFQLTKVPDIAVSDADPPQEAVTQAIEDGHLHREPVRANSLGRGLGDGMVVGTQLRLDPSAAFVRAKSQKQLSKSDSNAHAVQRAKSIRDLAQDLARRTGEVVAIDDQVDEHPPLPEAPVDLSVLEGRTRQRVPTTNFDDITSNPTSKPTNTQSYFYPEDPNPPNWKPWPMTQYYIFGIICISVGLGIAQEVMCRISQRMEKTNRGLLNFEDIGEVSTFDFFCWKYLPTLIFVIYGVLWQIMDFEIKRLEPYYQLSKPLGGTAAESLNLDHVSLWAYLVPFKAFRLRQWAVFCSAVGNLLTTSVCPSLQNPSVRFRENPRCMDKPCPGAESRFYVRMDPGWSRALTTFLFITAGLAVVLFIQMRRKSGLLSDPKGIAGIAAMATKSHILYDFQKMDLATHREIHKNLQHRRYLLYKSSIWQGEYDISQGSRYEGHQNLESPHPMMLRLKAGIPFIASLGFCLLIVPIINFTGARVIPNTLPWLPILVATLIKIVWTTFEFDVRMMEPFYILSKGKARPEMSLTLDYQGTVYGWFPIKALLNGHYLLALVGFSSILADMLTVTVSSFSVNGEDFLKPTNGPPSSDKGDASDETKRSFWGSVILSIVILSILILSAALVYALRRHPFLPRQPSTIAAVLAFIHASRMLYDFVDTETLNNKDMEKKLKEKGKRYGLGWFKGRDGQWHCAIDEEPMRSRYVHGVSYTMAQEPWNMGAGGGGMGGSDYHSSMDYGRFV